MKFRSVLCLSVCFVFALVVFGCGQKDASKGDSSSINVSHQPYFHGLPTYMAVKKGWDKEAGLKVNVQMYVSGPPQNEALASDKWEVGVYGSVPAMLASLRYGASIIAISNDESETNDLWVRPNSPILKVKGNNPKYPNIYGSAETLKGKTIMLTTASTGHYAAIATLRALGVDEKDVKIVHMEQAQAMAAFEAGQGDIVQLWAPFGFIAESKGWKKMSSGQKAGVMIPGLVVASKKAMENPAKVAKWLALYMRGIQEMKTNPEGSVKYLGDYYKENGQTFDEKTLKQEFALRPLYTTTEQLALFAKKDGKPSKIEQDMTALADFFVQQGRIKPEEKEQFLKSGLITDKILKMVAEQQSKK
jgi:ABC-type nitrate/sulfonate/bicarbonate transport system substrate-binding protein